MSSKEISENQDASKKNRHALGKNLSVGSIVRISGLASEKGQKMNGSVAEIVGGHLEGRFDIQMMESKDGGKMEPTRTRIKTQNLRVVCSDCFQDQKNFQYCAVCKVACYCNRQCQTHHWKTAGPVQHKLHCVEYKDEDDYKKSGQRMSDAWNEKHPEGIEWNKSMDHPSWSKLTQATRHSLRKLHAKSGCVVPWPVCVETPAMLDKIPSFLISHPNMKFKMGIISLPGGGFSPVIREKPFIGSAGFQQVPYHMPMPTQYVIIGEAIWTKEDYDDFKSYFDDPERKGRLFDWPGVECVGICPGTGERVQYSRNKKHLLVVCNMYGQALRGTSLNLCSRLMPRILTLKGYHKMLGEEKEDRCIPSRRGGFESGGTGDGYDEFYPTQMIAMSTYRGYVPPYPGAPMQASYSYDRYHASGEYTKYERYIEMNRAGGTGKIHLRP